MCFCNQFQGAFFFIYKYGQLRTDHGMKDVFLKRSANKLKYVAMYDCDKSGLKNAKEVNIQSSSCTEIYQKKKKEKNGVWNSAYIPIK